MKGFLYRKFMQFVHALGWHYAPPKEIINNEGYIDIIMWCEWCGLRSIMWHGTPNTACSGLAPAVASEDDDESGASH